MYRFVPRLAALAAIALLAACEREAPSEPEAPAAAASEPVATGIDPHSYAEYERIRVLHLTLDLDADFSRRTLSGYALLELERIDPDVNRLVLDTRDLDIRDVTGRTPDGEFEPLSWRLAEAREFLGTPLIVALPGGVDAVRVDYASSPDAFGLQWLDERQTLSGKPFLFSQSQPHHARTWVPLQDTPAVRYTFDAEIRVPRELMAVMGAAGNESERNDSGVYTFDMPEPIPSYLMAIGIGDLAFAETGPRSGIYAEPQLIEAAAEEFAELEDMIDIGEELYGPYRWGRYDLLILPPSFPFGGMENPRLSFITPTVIAGDRSLVALIAHELAHSWSGNLVTNAAWRDLWLNEGFTVYFESRITEALYGKERRDMGAVLAYRSLLDELAEAGESDRQLARDLSDRNPDDAFSSVPYIMGRLFLDWLEDRFGREDFDAFLRGYFDHFAFQSISTEDFRTYLRNHLVERYPGRVTMDEIDEWLYQPGLPETAVLPESDAFERVEAVSDQWLSGELAVDDLPADDWSVHEWRHFLTGLEDRIDAEGMAELDARFELTEATNYEILYLWLMRAIETHYEPAIGPLEDFLLRTGRMKFTRPLYQALADSDWGSDWAVEVYQRARPGYHPLTRQSAEAALGLSNEG